MKPIPKMRSYGNAEECWPIDFFCHKKKKEEARDAAMQRTLEVPQVDMKIIAGILGIGGFLLYVVMR